MIVALVVSVAVIAGAGVFEVVAARAVVEVEVEALPDGLGGRLRFDLHDGGDVHAVGQGLIGNENTVLLGEGQAGGGGTLAADDAD